MSRPPTPLAYHLRQGRQRAHLSQADVSRLTRHNQGQISAWENGRTIPQADTYLALCALYGIDPRPPAAVVDAYRAAG